MIRSDSCNALLVFPRFPANSFWNYQATCKVVGAKYSAAPLGYVTVAALLPPGWNVRLVDCNIEELSQEDIAWADLVMTGGMLSQQCDTLRIIARSVSQGKKIVVGGPDVTSSPEIYAQADFRILGEAEEVMGDMLNAWRSGAEGGTFRASRFPDLTQSPVPRFDLLKLKRYMHVGVQLSRGCPFRCEFCNVIELNGRSQRLKTTEQMLRELDTLYRLGYRGHVDFVDDNMIGNPKAVKPFLAELAKWVSSHGYPFEFSTEASINLADDQDLLDLMRKANFFAVFVGIETTDSESLRRSNKKQNMGHDIAKSIARIYQAGIFVNAGFIIGFDGEKDRIAQDMIDCIEAAAIPVCMVGLLYALPNTELSRRLCSEGRLFPDSDRVENEDDADQCTSGLNYVTERPRQHMLQDYRDVLSRIYEPVNYFGRVRRSVRALDVSGHRLRLPLRLLLRDLRSFGRIAWRLGFLDGESSRHWWRAFFDCLIHNPRAVKVTGSMGALFLHIEPFSRFMDAQITRRLASLAAETEPDSKASATAGI